MKNYLLILFAALSLAACSSDDGEKSTDKITGTWQLTQMTVDGDDFPLYPCDPLSSITFNADESMSEIVYYDNFEGDCIADDGYDYPGTWEKESGDLYRIFPAQPSMYHQSFNAAVSIEVLFSGENNIMKINVMEVHEGVNDGEPYLNEYYFDRVTGQQ